MKKIALDLDGVVFDSENLYRVYTEIYDVDVKHNNNLKDNTKRLFQDRYNWTADECKEIYNKIAPTVLNDANIMTGADIVLNKLKDKYELIVVTSRNDEETEIYNNRIEAEAIEVQPVSVIEGLQENIKQRILGTPFNLDIWTDEFEKAINKHKRN